MATQYALIGLFKPTQLGSYILQGSNDGLSQCSTAHMTMSPDPQQTRASAWYCLTLLSYSKLMMRDHARVRLMSVLLLGQWRNERHYGQFRKVI